MILGSGDSFLLHCLDRPWRLGGVEVPWMSSQIAVMILVGLLLSIALPLLARGRREIVPSGAGWIADLIVVFVRRWIVSPAMGEGPEGDRWAPYLTTLLCFLLGCNVAGLVPLLEISTLVGLHDTPVGGTATSSIYVCGAMAATTFAAIFVGGWLQSVGLLWKGATAAEQHRPQARGNLIMSAANALRRRRWPLPVAVVGGVVVWLDAFVPPIPGVVGLAMWPLLLVVECIGYVAKCFALCIRLFANMVSGHILLAVLVGLAAASRGWENLPGALPGAIAAALMLLLEAVVAVLQAYIFTLLSAVFIGMATNPRH